MNQSIIIRVLPNLIKQTIIEDIPDLFSICQSDDQKTLYAINRSGKYIEIIKNTL